MLIVDRPTSLVSEGNGQLAKSFAIGMWGLAIGGGAGCAAGMLLGPAGMAAGCAVGGVLGSLGVGVGVGAMLYNFNTPYQDF